MASFADPQFGIAYILVVAILLVGLIWTSRAALRLKHYLIIGAAVGIGYLIGILIASRSANAIITAPGSSVTIVATPSSTTSSAPVTSQPSRRAERIRTMPATLIGTSANALGVNYLDVASASTPGISNPLSVSKNQDLIVAGWAFDPPTSGLCSSLIAQVDTNTAYAIPYGMPRPDVSSYFKNAALLRTGFVGVFRVPHAGPHRLTFKCLSARGEVLAQSQQTFVVNVR